MLLIFAAFGFVAQGVVWTVLAGVLVAVLAALVRRNRKPTLHENVAEILQLIEQQESSAARDMARNVAKLLSEEVDESPTPARLALQLRQYATEANLPAISGRVDDLLARMARSEAKKNRRTVRFLSLLLLLLSIWLLVGLFPMYVIYYLDYAEESPATWLFPNRADGNEKTAPSMKEFFETTGTVGDAYGAINSLFTAAALAGAVYSIVLQTKELSLQREEMTMTRKELSRSTEAHKRSESSLEAQAVINGLHYLAESQRLRAANAPNELERHRANGKERAHVARLELQLQSLGRPIFAAERSMQVREAIAVFEFAVRRLHESYLDVRAKAANAQEAFAAVEGILCDVAEEVEMIHLLLPASAAAGLALTNLVGLIGQIVYRIDIQPDLSAEAERQLRERRCEDCFSLLERTIESMKHFAVRPSEETLPA